jgi:hypothetical protein
MVVFTIYSTTEITKWGALSTWRKALTLIGVFAVLLTGYYTIKDFRKEAREGQINATFGEIKAKKTVKTDDVLLRIRGSGANLAGTPTFNFPDSQETVQVLKYEGRLYLKANVRDGDGELIATVNGTYWKMYNDQYDYNYDDTAFEVVTPDKRVVFQVDLMGNYVDFAGLIISEDRRGVYLWARDGRARMQKITRSYVIPRNLVTPIFKYPREKFLGQRNGG